MERRLSHVFAAIEHVLEENPSGPGSQSVPRDGDARPDATGDGYPRLSGRHGRGLVRDSLWLRSSVRRAAFEGQWLLAYQFGDQRSLAPREDTHFAFPPLDRYWADPMVVFVDGEHHVFFEEFPYKRGRGRICTMRLGETGLLEESRPVLEADYHLSYPFLFEFDGDRYMIPESAEARRIDLYRAVEFPGDWERVGTLMDDVVAYDTTLVPFEGLWWMFTSIDRLGRESAISHLYLFSSDSPLSTKWEPHPMNPIVSGTAGARGAGGFIERDGHLLRPSQDSSRTYGGAVQLRKILTLTRADYRERPAGSLAPAKARGFFGLHTVSQAHGLTVVDLCRWARRR